GLNISLCVAAAVGYKRRVKPYNEEISKDFARLGQQHVKGSKTLTSKFLSGDFGDLSRSYIGPCPPDKDHLYNLKVFALDKFLNLSEGFYLNDLHHTMKGHILAQTSLELVGRA
ncbi:YbhB/YbcL family Raf kinase inhibitor-like protein, partial [Streptococcus hyovaginalis]